jgi:glycine/D-amino acid oxidase-like deaminating enzyme
MSIADDLAGLHPGVQRGWWLREALAAEAGRAPAAPPLRGDETTDVVVVGGGYTGLWTAWFLRELDPSVGVTILEADICGGGASGRNGGFLEGWWNSLGALVRSYGEADGLRAALEVEAAPAAVGAWCDVHGVDAWYRPAGTMLVSASPAQDGAWDRNVRLAERLGVGDRFVPLSAEEVRERCASPRLRGGVLLPGEVNIQPARLARGLRRALLERGVIIHEGSRVVRLDGHDPLRPLRAITSDGQVGAERAVLALNAWASGWPGFGARMVTWSSYMVIPEPIPDRLAAIGWTGGEGISDCRFTNHYFRTTPDGRIALGGGGGRAGYGGRLGEWVTRDLDSVRLAVRGFRRLFPMLDDVRLVDAWGGPIDISSNHLPWFGTLPPGNVHFGHGYSGVGLGASWLGGRILAALALDRDDPVRHLPMVGHPPRRFPPEPFRYAGARVIREAIVAKEQRDDLGRRRSWLLAGLSRVPRWVGYDLGPE